MHRCSPAVCYRLMHEPVGNLIHLAALAQVLAQHAVVEAARDDVRRLEARERDVREVLQARACTGQQAARRGSRDSSLLVRADVPG
jgi:hypothetical protein